MTSFINQQIAAYYEWLQSSTYITQDSSSEWVEITTPYFGFYNDPIELYAKCEKNGKITLSDDGVTLHNLDLAGVTLRASEKRKQLINSILINYGIRMNAKAGELTTETSIKDFPVKMHSLISAILQITDMQNLSTPNVTSFFLDDVQQYLDELQVVYTPQFIAKGKTGFEFTFDFQIAKPKSELVIKSFNRLSRSQVSNFLFSWGDIKANREAQSGKALGGMAIINDEGEEIKQEYIDALESRGTKIIPWSRRQEDGYKSLIIA